MVSPFADGNRGWALALNVALRIAELYQLIRGGQTSATRSVRTIEALGLSVKLRIFRPVGQCCGVVLDVHGGGWTIGNAGWPTTRTPSSQPRSAQRWSVSITGWRSTIRSAPWSMIARPLQCGPLRTRRKNSAPIGGRPIESVAGAMLYFGLYDFSGTAMVRAAGPETLLLHGPTVRATLCKLTPHMNDDERRAPATSPLYADLSGLPPALFAVGTKDMLLEDSERMAARWDDANGNAELLVAPEMPHAFDRMDTAIARKTQHYVEEWIVARFDAPAETLGQAFPRTVTRGA